MLEVFNQKSKDANWIESLELNFEECEGVSNTVS